MMEASEGLLNASANSQELPIYYGVSQAHYPLATQEWIFQPKQIWKIISQVNCDLQYLHQ